MPCALCGNPKTPKGEPLCNLHRHRVNEDLEAMLKEQEWANCLAIHRMHDCKCILNLCEFYTSNCSKFGM